LYETRAPIRSCGRLGALSGIEGDWRPGLREDPVKVREVLAELHYVGEAVGVRQKYYVFQGQQHYLVLSFKKDDDATGNFNIVEADAVAYVEEKYRGEKGLTSKQLFEESRRTKRFRDRFVALNALYVLVAAGKASVDHRFKPGTLVFNLL
jgi:hypothetical protein